MVKAANGQIKKDYRELFSRVGNPWRTLLVLLKKQSLNTNKTERRPFTLEFQVPSAEANFSVAAPSIHTNMHTRTHGCIKVTEYKQFRRQDTVCPRVRRKTSCFRAHLR